MMKKRPRSCLVFMLAVHNSFLGRMHVAPPSCRLRTWQGLSAQSYNAFVDLPPPLPSILVVPDECVR